MGATCCRCYKEPTTNENKVKDEISHNSSSNGKNGKRKRSIEKANSISSMSPAASNTMNDETNGTQNGKTLNGKLLNGNYDDNNNEDPETRKKLIEFYQTHNPSKLKDEAAINEVLRRYKGRETKLFADLNRKYVEQKPKTEDNDNNNTLKQKDDDDKIKKKESIGSDDDENKPLNGHKNKVNVDANASKIDNNNNKKKIRTPISPQSMKKQLLASESPPESEADEEDIEITAHPILADIQGDKSESVPINGGLKKKKNGKKGKETPTSPISELRVQINDDKDGDNKESKLGKLDNVGFPSLNNNNNSFKIEVTKPKKNSNSFKNRKINGTNLFGAQIGKSLSNGGGHHGAHRSDNSFGKPLFGNNTSNSYSQSRSTSFIAGQLDTPHSFGDDLPKFGSNIKRSNTLTLDSSHKDKLDKRRQSSLLVRRNQNRRNLPIRINKVWAMFAQYIIDKMVEEKQAEKDLKKEQEQEEDTKLEKPKKSKRSKKKSQDSSLMDIDEDDIELTPEPQDFNSPETDTNDILDSIINSNKDDKNKKKSKSGINDLFDEDDNDDYNDKHKKGHESIEVLAIDPRLFADAKTKRGSKSISRSSQSSSASSTDGDDDSDGINVDPYELELTYAQYNIVLNNNQIAVSPDMSAALVWLLLDTNKMLDDEVKALGNESDNLHNNPMKERGFHSKQFKKIYKCKITYKMIDTLMKRLNNGSVSRQDKSLHPKHLSYEKRNLVIWDKIFEHLLNKTSFNVEEDYLFGALQEEDLRDGDKIIDMLSSLESHWQHRVQLMEHIDDKLSNGSPMERDIFFASILSNNDNYIKVLTGWSCQLTDDRSGVARTGVMLLPAVLSSILLCITYPAILFDEERVINPIYNGIFTLVKNRRLKDMADDAYESLIQVTDIFGEVASDLKDFELLKMIIKVLEDHSNPKIEKHDKARESCIGGIGFLLYGVEPPTDETQAQNEKPSQKRSTLLPNIDENNKPRSSDMSIVSTPIGALSDKDRENGTDDIKMPDLPDHVRGFSTGLAKANSAEKTGTKLSKLMQRDYLLQNEEFVISFGNILKNGVTDKSESGRRKAFKLLQRLENEKDGKLLEELSSKWDFTIQKKYKNWKKLNQRKKNSTIKKSGKKKKRSTKKKKKSTLKNQVKNLKKKGKEKKDEVKFVPSKVDTNTADNNDNTSNDKKENNDINIDIDSPSSANTKITISSPSEVDKDISIDTDNNNNNNKDTNVDTEYAE